MNHYLPPTLRGQTLPLHDPADTFFAVGLDGTILDWNTRAVLLFGWSTQAAVGCPLDELLLAPACRATWKHTLQYALVPRVGHALKKRTEVIMLHRDGHEIAVEATITGVGVGETPHFMLAIRDISRQRKTEQALRERTALLNLCREAIIATDMDDRIVFWNAGAEQMYGYLAEDAIGRRRKDVLRCIPESAFEDILREVENRGSWEGELRQARRDGSFVTALCRYIIERGSHGNPVRLMMANTDISRLQQVLETSTLLRATEQRFASLFEHHTDGVFAFNPMAHLTMANPALCELTGYGRKQLLSMPLAQLVAPQHLAEVRRCFLEAMRGKPQTCDLVCIRSDGTSFEANMIMLPNIIDGNVAGVHGIVKDISHRKSNERRIEYLANHDALTGLPNRNLLEERMKHAIEHAKRLDTRIGVLFMDLNRFKVINDSLGHEVGDLLLCTIADRLKAAVREGDTVARLGGDEFVVVLENIHECEQMARVAHLLLKVVSQPIELSGHTLTVSTSVGGSIYPADGQDTVSLFKNADLAMYAAKAAGVGVFRLYDPAMHARAVERLHRENSLRQALEQNQFVLHYQPRLDMARNTIVGVEALVRWNHPRKGMIFPNNFIPLAEEMGLIDELGEWVLRTACRQLKSWQEENLLPIRMSVNLSTMQLGSEGIRDTVRNALADTALESRFLELEITESSLMQDIDACTRTLNDIRQLGVSLSIDDFGTGYSSLGYLKRLPIDTLKIDKSFVGDMAHDSDDAAIVSATIAMAHRMNLRVVAEGVTTHDQIRFLDAYRCDEIQGYLLCQPLPADEVAMFFNTSRLRGIGSSSIN